MSKVSFFDRLFNTKKAQQAEHDKIEKYKEYLIETVKSLSEQIVREDYDKLLSYIAENKIREEEEKKKKEEDRIASFMNSDEPWYEIKDINGDYSDIANYRWNPAFINKHSITHGLTGRTAKEVFSHFLEEREFERRQEIIRSEKEKMYDSPEPWLEWTIRGGVTDQGYPVYMEWNPAFIKHINSQGFVGRNEEEMVRLWLSGMVRYKPNNKNDYE